MGFEPTTFCMASSSSDSVRALNFPANGNASAARVGAGDARLSPENHGSFRTQTGPKRAGVGYQGRRLRAVVTYNHMVVGSEGSKTDDIFHALADPTRRDILRRAGGDAPSVSRLADAYPMSFAAVQKHVAVLERAGLVTKRRRGREQLVEAAPEGLADARRALEDLEEIWRGRVERMSELLASDSEQDERKP